MYQVSFYSMIERLDGRYSHDEPREFPTMEDALQHTIKQVQCATEALANTKPALQACDLLLYCDHKFAEWKIHFEKDKQRAGKQRARTSVVALHLTASSEDDLLILVDNWDETCDAICQESVDAWKRSAGESSSACLRSTLTELRRRGYQCRPITGRSVIN